jgi:hypothetical protein
MPALSFDFCCAEGQKRAPEHHSGMPTTRRTTAPTSRPRPSQPYKVPEKSDSIQDARNILADRVRRVIGFNQIYQERIEDL